jgi:tetratricopeptide (TPR) repeat protein
VRAGCRGLTYRLMGRYDDALADFTRAIELDPSHGDYAVKRAEIHQLMGERGARVCPVEHS